MKRLTLFILILAMAAGLVGQVSKKNEYPLGWLSRSVAASMTSYIKDDGTVQLTADWNVGAFDLTCVDMNATNFKLSGTGTLASTAGNATFTTALTAASGNEAAFSLNYTTNKAAGNDTGLLINQTDTASPGTSLLADFQVGGSSRFSLSNRGVIVINGTDNIYISPYVAAVGDLPRGPRIGSDIDMVFANTNGNAYGSILGAHNGTKWCSGLEYRGTASGLPVLLLQRSLGPVENMGASITAGSGTGLTVNIAGNINRQTYVVTVTYAAFAAAALTGDKTIATLPAKTKIVGFYADTTTKFTGGAVSAASLTVGKSAGGVEYIATHDVFTAAITVGLADADMGTELTRAAAIQGGAVVNWTGTTTVSARLTTVTANTDQLTAGSVTFYIVTERF